MVDLFEKIEEGVEFSEAANTPIPEGKVFNIAYLLIFRTGGIEKACEQWKDMQVGLKAWKDFKDHFTQAYRRYQIHKKATGASNGYGVSEYHKQGTEAQENTA